MSIFIPRKSFLASGLLRGATDVHCHLLPGVDDGARNFTESLEALRRLYELGVERLYLTPHVMSDVHKNTRSYLLDAFEVFVSRFENFAYRKIPKLKLAAEYMLEPAFEKRCKEGLLTFADAHVLVETSYITPPVGLTSILERLLEKGYSPVLAHPERYRYMDGEEFFGLKNLGVKFQLNMLSLAGAYGKDVRVKSGRMLRKDMYDFAGSDFHHLEAHEPFLEARALSKKMVAALKQLFENNKTLW